MLTAHVVESVIVLIVLGVLLSIALQRFVRSRSVARLSVLVSQEAGCRCRWDVGIPILEIDASTATPSHVIKILRQAAKCRLRYFELLLHHATDELAAEVGRISTLETLRIEDGILTDVGVSRLAGLRKLEMLMIRNCPVSNASLSIIAQFEQLEGLSLEGTRLSGADFGPLLKLPQLQCLNLSRTDIKDEALDLLLKHPTIRDVDVTSTGCTAAFVEMWRASHPNSRIQIEI